MFSHELFLNPFRVKSGDVAGKLIKAERVRMQFRGEFFNAFNRPLDQTALL